MLSEGQGPKGNCILFSMTNRVVQVSQDGVLGVQLVGHLDLLISVLHSMPNSSKESEHCALECQGSRSWEHNSTQYIACSSESK
jgi:hypothetical protein